MLFDSHRLKPDKNSTQALRRPWLMSCVSLALSSAILAFVLAVVVSRFSLFLQPGAGESNARSPREGGSTREGVQFGAASVQTGAKSSLLKRFTSKQCVSIVYKKPAKSGSSTTSIILRTKLPQASVPDCWRGNEFDPIEERLNSTVAPFDIYKCHSSYDPTTMAALAEHSRYPIVHLTTIRDPFEQLVSLYYHKNRKECGKGELPSAEKLQTFVQTTYFKYLPTFQSRMYNVTDLSAKVGREECGFFDVIWKTEDLEAVLGEKKINKANAAKNCPESDQMKQDQGLVDVLMRASEEPRELYNELLKCENLRNDFPWEWDADQGCIVTKES